MLLSKRIEDLYRLGYQLYKINRPIRKIILELFFCFVVFEKQQNKKSFYLSFFNFYFPDDDIQGDLYHCERKRKSDSFLFRDCVLSFYQSLSHPPTPKKYKPKI